MLGASTTSLLGGSYANGGTWKTSSFGSGSPRPPSLTINAAGVGVGVFEASTGTLYDTIWSASAWSTPAIINGTAISRTAAAPWVDANNGPIAHAVYQDTNYKYWYLAYSGTGSSPWSSPTPVGTTSAAQDCGNFAATIAALGQNATVAFYDGACGANDNAAAETDLLSGAWQPTKDLATNTIGGSTSITIPPVIVALGSGSDLLMVYADNGSNLQSVRRTAGTWSASPLAVTGASTANYIALAPLANGGAILAFRGNDNMLYWSLYASTAWTTVAPFSSPNITIDATPAVARGIGSDVAEIAYVQGGVAYHARLSSTDVWSLPVSVGGTGLFSVALASTP